MAFSNIKNLRWHFLMAICANKLSINVLFIQMSFDYEGESIKKQPNLFLGEIDLFFFDVITL